MFESEPASLGMWRQGFLENSLKYVCAGDDALEPETKRVRFTGRDTEVFYKSRRVHI